jgi:multiple sugar transport system permease protein
LAILFLLPFVWLFALSVKSLDNFYTYPPQLFTPNPQWSNFSEVLEKFSLLRYFGNSLLVSFISSLLQLALSTTAAFAFAVLHFKGKNTLFMFFLSSMMVPGTVILIPLFLIVQQLGLINSYGGMILPFIFTGYGIFMIRQFFMSLPRDFFEAARMDGCGYLMIFLKIYLPLSKPALATLGTLSFMNFYNSLLWPLIVINDDEMKTIPVGIAGLVGVNASYPHLIMAGAALTIIPGILIFILLQRYFVSGFVMSGVKG